MLLLVKNSLIYRAIEALSTCWKHYHFSEKDKIQMLSTVNSNGKSIIYNILSDPKLRVCSEQIILLIANSNLTEDNKIQLLQAKTATGSNWLYDILQANKVEEVRSYANFILNTNELGENTKQALLTPINVDPISINILAKNAATEQLAEILAKKHPTSYQQGYSDETIRALHARKITKLERAGRTYTVNGDLINYPSKGRYIKLNCKVPAFHKQDTRIGEKKYRS